MKNVILPNNLNRILLKYREEEHDKIKQKYRQEYKNTIDDIHNNVEEKFDLHKYNHDTHCKLLSYALTLFLEQKIKNYELLFLEPLLYLRNIGKIPKDIKIWDFILGEIKGKKLNRIILGEVKGQKAKGNMDEISSLVEIYTKNGVLNNILNYIEDLFTKNKKIGISIDRNEIKIEMILVVQGLHYRKYENSIKDRNLFLNVWSINVDVLRKKYTIEIHRKEKIYGRESIYSENEKEYRSMLSFLKNKEFKENTIFNFTYASDIDLYLNFIYKSYLNIFDLEFSEENLIELINQAGGGKFYDDKRVITDMVAKLTSQFNQYDMLITEGSKIRFKQDVKLKEKIIKDRIRRGLRRKQGEDLLNQVIKELKPKRSAIGMTKQIDDYL